MPRKEYLTSEARQRFDNPPVLSVDQKIIFLEAPEWAAEYVKTLQTPSNKVGFLDTSGWSAGFLDRTVFTKVTWTL